MGIMYIDTQSTTNSNRLKRKRKRNANSLKLGLNNTQIKDEGSFPDKLLKDVILTEWPDYNYTARPMSRSHYVVFQFLCFYLSLLLSLQSPG